MRKAAALRPDVVLLDLTMPLGSSVEATKHIVAERPEQPVCILTLSEQEQDLFAAVRAGARGYLMKSVALEELCVALQVLAEGGAVIRSHLVAHHG